MKKAFISPIGKYFSAIGLGCVTFGREISRAASFEIMDFASEHGITFFDTAASYGAGVSEEIVGAWLSENPSASRRIIVSTKIQPPYDPGNIMDSVDQSLNRLQRDSIDVLYLHRWDETIVYPNVLKAFNDLLKTDKVKLLGASNFNAGQLEKVIRLQQIYGYDLFQSLQNNNNLAVRDIDSDIIKICTQHDIKIVTYSPLGAGFLTGKYKRGVKGDTRFSVIKGHQDVYFNEASFNRLKRLEELSSLTGYSTTHLALAWALHRQYVTSVLVGGRCKEQLGQAFSARSFYDADIFNELESI